MTTPTRSSGGQQPRSSGRSQSQRSGSRQSSQTSRSQSSSTQSRSGQSRSGQSGGGQSAQGTSRSGGARSGGSRSSASQSGGPTVRIPFVTAQFHAADVHVPGKQEITSAANSAVESAGSAVSAVREQMPSREHAIFYGALGGAAALSVIEWPVALAIGVGTALVSRRKSGNRSSAR